MFYFDPLYLILTIPPMLLALYAQAKVKSTFMKYSQVPTLRGMSGADVAAAILRTRRIHDVKIEPVEGTLSDHYDPTTKTLRLSPEVYGGRTVAAAGVAAHEVGHAIQHAESYRFLTMRSNLVPLLGFTSKLALPTLMIGFVMMSAQSALGQPILLAGIALFSVMVLFQLVTLPVEFDASRRALLAIQDGGIVDARELVGAKKVLSAAALTYVAAAVSSVATLLYFLIRSGLLGGRRD